MAGVWGHSERALCTHPGWARLRGWGAVASSWFALFQGPQQLQFVLTEERIDVVGDVAWVSVDENLLGSQGGATVAALNVFVREPGRGVWRLGCHHRSGVSTPIEGERGGGAHASHTRALWVG